MSAFGLNAGLRAILASRFALDTIGHNISNATTPGYSRQQIDLGASAPILSGGLLVGTGVDARSVRRTVDNLLSQRLLVQSSVRGRLESRFTGLSEVEALFLEPDGASLGAQLDGFFGAASSLSSSPSDSILRTELASSAIQATTQFNALSSGLAGLRRDTAREIQIRADEVNVLGARISDLNAEISAATFAGLAPNDLLDARDLAISELSELVDVTTQSDPSGAVRVLVGGSTLVSTTRFFQMKASATIEGSVTLSLQGSSGTLDLSGGVLGGLLKVAQSDIPRLTEKLDSLAQALIRETNRVHSTGMPASGPYESLVGTSTFVDVDGDGNFRDELLSNAALPDAVLSGELFVNVSDLATGELARNRIAISASHTTVGDFLDAIDAIPNVSANLDGLGRLQIRADDGFGFDFTRRLDPTPDGVGAFGGGQASLSTPASGPFALTDGDTIQLDVGGTPITVTLNASDFEQIAAATAEEIAAVIDADPTAQANGITASVSGGRLVLQTAGAGSAESFDLVGGTALGALGLAGLAGTTVSGHDTNVDVEISGQYTGAVNDAYTFRPLGDGTVGTTPGLAVEVVDGSGQVVTTLDVGAGYLPGSKLNVADGVEVSFGLGELSATHNDAFSTEVIADSDTSDVLLAAGIGSFFEGDDAASIALADRIANDPGQIATSTSGSSGDNSALLDLLEIESRGFSELGSAGLGEFYGEIVGELGFEVGTTVDAIDANSALVASLEAREQQISGVNVDEELVRLIEFEQAFQAASRYINVMSELNDDLLALI